MPILTKLRDFLDESGVAYQVLDHRQAFTAQEVAAAQHVSGKELAKVVMLRCGDEFVMAVLRAPDRIDVEHVRTLLEASDVRLATEEEFAGLFPNCEPGAMPPFGNLYGLPVWVDEALAEDAEIVFNAGSHTQAVRMGYAEFAQLVKPKVAKLAQRD
jgi:Ala-tRNA(Pro) deacylase